MAEGHKGSQIQDNLFETAETWDFDGDIMQPIEPKLWCNGLTKYLCD